jgi:hypothetical protein
METNSFSVEAAFRPMGNIYQSLLKLDSPIFEPPLSIPQYLAEVLILRKADDQLRAKVLSLAQNVQALRI